VFEQPCPDHLALSFVNVHSCVLARCLELLEAIKVDPDHETFFSSASDPRAGTVSSTLQLSARVLSAVIRTCDRLMPSHADLPLLPLLRPLAALGDTSAFVDSVFACLLSITVDGQSTASARNVQSLQCILLCAVRPLLHLRARLAAVRTLGDLLSLNALNAALLDRMGAIDRVYDALVLAQEHSLVIELDALLQYTHTALSRYVPDRVLLKYLATLSAPQKAASDPGEDLGLLSPALQETFEQSTSKVADTSRLLIARSVSEMLAHLRATQLPISDAVVRDAVTALGNTIVELRALLDDASLDRVREEEEEEQCIRRCMRCVECVAHCILSHGQLVTSLDGITMLYDIVEMSTRHSVLTPLADVALFTLLQALRSHGARESAVHKAVSLLNDEFLPLDTLCKTLHVLAAALFTHAGTLQSLLRDCGILDTLVELLRRRHCVYETLVCLARVCRDNDRNKHALGRCIGYAELARLLKEMALVMDDYLMHVLLELATVGSLPCGLILEEETHSETNSSSSASGSSSNLQQQQQQQQQHEVQYVWNALPRELLQMAPPSISPVVHRELRVLSPSPSLSLEAHEACVRVLQPCVLFDKALPLSTSAARHTFAWRRSRRPSLSLSRSRRSQSESSLADAMYEEDDVDVAEFVTTDRTDRVTDDQSDRDGSDGGDHSGDHNGGDGHDGDDAQQHDTLLTARYVARPRVRAQRYHLEATWPTDVVLHGGDASLLPLLLLPHAPVALQTRTLRALHTLVRANGANALALHAAHFVGFVLQFVARYEIANEHEWLRLAAAVAMLDMRTADVDLALRLVAAASETEGALSQHIADLLISAAAAKRRIPRRFFLLPGGGEDVLCQVPTRALTRFITGRTGYTLGVWVHVRTSQQSQHVTLCQWQVGDGSQTIKLKLVRDGDFCTFALENIRPDMTKTRIFDELKLPVSLLNGRWFYLSLTHTRHSASLQALPETLFRELRENLRAVATLHAGEEPQAVKFMQETLGLMSPRRRAQLHLLAQSLETHAEEYPSQISKQRTLRLVLGSTEDNGSKVALRLAAAGVVENDSASEGETEALCRSVRMAELLFDSNDVCVDSCNIVASGHSSLGGDGASHVGGGGTGHSGSHNGHCDISGGHSDQVLGGSGGSGSGTDVSGGTGDNGGRCADLWWLWLRPTPLPPPPVAPTDAETRDTPDDERDTQESSMSPLLLAAQEGPASMLPLELDDAAVGEVPASVSLHSETPFRPRSGRRLSNTMGDTSVFLRRAAPSSVHATVGVAIVTPHSPLVSALSMHSEHEERRDGDGGGGNNGGNGGSHGRYMQDMLHPSCSIAVEPNGLMRMLSTTAVDWALLLRLFESPRTLWMAFELLFAVLSLTHAESAESFRKNGGFDVVGHALQSLSLTAKERRRAFAFLLSLVDGRTSVPRVAVDAVLPLTGDVRSMHAAAATAADDQDMQDRKRQLQTGALDDLLQEAFPSGETVASTTTTTVADGAATAADGADADTDGVGDTGTLDDTSTSSRRDSNSRQDNDNDNNNNNNKDNNNNNNNSKDNHSDNGSESDDTDTDTADHTVDSVDPPLHRHDSIDDSKSDISTRTTHLGDLAHHTEDVVPRAELLLRNDALLALLDCMKSCRSRALRLRLSHALADLVHVRRDNISLWFREGAPGMQAWFEMLRLDRGTLPAVSVALDKIALYAPVVTVSALWHWLATHPTQLCEAKASVMTTLCRVARRRPHVLSSALCSGLHQYRQEGSFPWLQQMLLLLRTPNVSVRTSTLRCLRALLLPRADSESGTVSAATLAESGGGAASNVVVGAVAVPLETVLDALDAVLCDDVGVDAGAAAETTCAVSDRVADRVSDCVIDRTVVGTVLPVDLATCEALLELALNAPIYANDDSPVPHSFHESVRAYGIVRPAVIPLLLRLLRSSSSIDVHVALIDKIRLLAASASIFNDALLEAVAQYLTAVGVTTADTSPTAAAAAASTAAATTNTSSHSSSHDAAETGEWACASMPRTHRERCARHVVTFTASLFLDELRRRRPAQPWKALEQSLPRVQSLVLDAALRQVDQTPDVLLNRQHTADALRNTYTWLNTYAERPEVSPSLCLRLVRTINALASHSDDAVRNKMRDARLFDLRDALVLRAVRPTAPLAARVNVVLSLNCFDMLMGTTRFQNTQCLLRLLSLLCDAVRCRDASVTPEQVSQLAQLVFPLLTAPSQKKIVSRISSTLATAIAEDFVVAVSPAAVTAVGGDGGRTDDLQRSEDGVSGGEKLLCWLRASDLDACVAEAVAAVDAKFAALRHKYARATSKWTSDRRKRAAKRRDKQTRQRQERQQRRRQLWAQLSKLHADLLDHFSHMQRISVYERLERTEKGENMWRELCSRAVERDAAQELPGSLVDGQ
ncbi:MAG: hypothetical protein MHM6MM_003355, partial [Cercozoa sp. M6MM]